MLIAGGGVAALEASLALRALAEDRVSVELLAPEPQFWYRPLAVAEPFGLGEVRHFELPKLAAAAGATFSPGALTAVDVEKRQARTSADDAIAYDLLLVACGAVPSPAVSRAMTFRARPTPTKSGASLQRSSPVRWDGLPSSCRGERSGRCRSTSWL